MKRWYQSRTLWFNIATGMVGLGTELLAVVELVPDDWQSLLRAALIIVTALGNAILRFLTSQPIEKA